MTTFPLTWIWGFLILKIQVAIKPALSSPPCPSIIALNGFQEVSGENNTETRSKRNWKGFRRKHYIKAIWKKVEAKKKKQKTLKTTKTSCHGHREGFAFFFQNDFWWHVVSFLCFLTLRGWQIVLFGMSIVTPEVLCRVESIISNSFSWPSGKLYSCYKWFIRRNDTQTRLPAWKADGRARCVRRAVHSLAAHGKS